MEIKETYEPMIVFVLNWMVKKRFALFGLRVFGGRENKIENWAQKSSSFCRIDATNKTREKKYSTIIHVYDEYKGYYFFINNYRSKLNIQEKKTNAIAHLLKSVFLLILLNK